MPLILDQSLLPGKRGESLRWFLYPREAQQVLLSKYTNAEKNFELPFIPRQYGEDGLVITRQDITDDNINVNQTVGDNYNSDAQQTVLDPVQNKSNQQKSKICVGKIVLSRNIERIFSDFNKSFIFTYFL